MELQWETPFMTNSIALARTVARIETLADISHEKTQIIVFPLPLDLIRPLLDRRE